MCKSVTGGAGMCSVYVCKYVNVKEMDLNCVCIFMCKCEASGAVLWTCVMAQNSREPWK